MPLEIARKISDVRDSIKSAAGRAGRKADEVGLVLVTKYVEPVRIREAFEVGMRDFGENKVQEFMGKADVLPSEIKWHFVGRLQTNKVKYLMGKTELIHSLDRLELAEEIERQASKKGIAKVSCLVQVNSSGEQTKAGLAPHEVLPFVKRFQAGTPVEVRGLMSIGPHTEDPSRIRHAFRVIKTLFDGIKKELRSPRWDILSMGMSLDYEIAIEEGANLLRIGTAVFGPRIQK